jgi:hypothetical protein
VTGRRRWFPLLLAALAGAVVVDLAVGAALAGTGALPPDDRGDLLRAAESGLATDLSAPAIADEPWVDDYRSELLAYQTTVAGYAPFLVQQPPAFEGEHLNTTALERRTYTPPNGGEPVRIGVFGGSAVFGIGQRDEHTIASELARLAAAEGVDVEVHNYGLPSWVAWQELQQFERVLAGGHDLDLAVFLDGHDDLAVQSESVSEDPTHHDADAMQEIVDDYAELHEEEPTVGGLWQELGDAYVRASGAARIIDRLVGEPADPPGGSAGDSSSAEEAGRAATEVYGRAVDRIHEVADDHDVAVRLFWQPQRDGWPAEVVDRLPDGVTDLSGLFAGEEDEYYIDAVNTNEAGARVLAEALWQELRDEVTAP